MQERRTLVYLSNDGIPSSAREATVGMTGNVFYIPAYLTQGNGNDIEQELIFSAVPTSGTIMYSFLSINDIMGATINAENDSRISFEDLQCWNNNITCFLSPRTRFTFDSDNLSVSGNVISIMPIVFTYNNSSYNEYKLNSIANGVFYSNYQTRPATMFAGYLKVSVLTGDKIASEQFNNLQKISLTVQTVGGEYPIYVDTE